MIYTNKSVSIGVDSIGGNITSFQVDGDHIFFPQQALKENNELKIRGGSHICFPNFGSQKNPQDFKVQKHGFLRERPVQISYGSSMYAAYVKDNFCRIDGMDTDESYKFILSHYEYNANERDFPKFFPFSFSLDSTLFFLEKGFAQVIKISHSGNKDVARKSIPINPAFHPYINTRMSRVAIDGLEKERIGFWNDSSVDGLSYPMASPITIIREKMDRKIKMQFGGLFAEVPDARIVLWRNYNNSPYFCIEPVAGNSHKFGTEYGHFLRPDQDSVCAWMKVEVE